MEILIFGCSRLTNALAPALVRNGHQVTVVDPSADRLALLQKEEAAIIPILAAEPLMQDYLQQGGISDSWVFLALSEDDHKNALVGQVARRIFNVPQVFCHLSDPQLQEFYSNLDLELVGPMPDFVEDILQSIGRQRQ